MNVYVVDDAPFFVKICESYIEELGHSMCGFSLDGDNAVEKISELSPDLVMLDMVLPGKNGLNVAKDLRKLKSSVKIIGMSSLELDDLKDSAISAGCNIFLTKPFSLEDCRLAFDQIERLK